MKKFTAVLAAIAIAAPMVTSAINPALSGIKTVFAEEVTPELTVVGKRITGDDTYFEISLEVNGDYREYSSVGVVLEYDPCVIVPAASWDDKALEADMSENTSWATRRALPTLGLPSWTTHTALTYFDPADNTKAYLYLGAEYPGETPSYARDPEASAAPGAPVPTLSPATPAPSADPSDPHNQPVVAARFMYKPAASDGKTTTTKQNIINSWKTDWAQNPIITVADYDISGKSPAQCGFVIHKADFTSGSYQPSPLPTTNPTYAVGTALDADKLEIVTCEGKSAKSGGLSLSDIYVTLFYDWDDSLIGSLTCGAGEDSSAAVDAYVKEKFIHPDLQENTNYTSAARADNYRGEYPYSGPNGSNPTVPGGTGCYPDGSIKTDGGTTVDTSGSSYPLTNKLEYCFAGRDINSDEDGNPLPFVGGWTRVTPDTMSETWTALGTSDNFARTVDADADGEPDMNTDETAFVDADGKDIDMVSYNFSDVDSVAKDIDGGVLYVKAVYTPGEWLDNNNILHYTAIAPIQYGIVQAGVYSINYEYRRINSLGYGVTKIKKLSVKMDLKQKGASGSTPIEIPLESGEIMSVSLTPTDDVDTVSYQLKDASVVNYIAGADKSAINGLNGGNPIQLQGPEGIIFSFNASTYLENAYEMANSGKVTAFAAVAFTNMKLSQDITGKTVAATKRKSMTQAIVDCVKEAIAVGEDYTTLTWYQLQYAMLNTSAPYVDKATAKEEIEKYPKLMDKING